MELGTLAGGLGCFPLDYGTYHPQSDSRATLDGIRSLIGVGNRGKTPSPFSALPPT
jgi:hypothetical protein